MSSQNITTAQTNWEQVRDFLCGRIHRQQTALARLTSATEVEENSLDPRTIDTAAKLVALVEATERQFDHAFTQQSVRPVDPPVHSDSHRQGGRDYQTR